MFFERRLMQIVSLLDVTLFLLLTQYIESSSVSIRFKANKFWVHEVTFNSNMDRDHKQPKQVLLLATRKSPVNRFADNANSYSVPLVRVRPRPRVSFLQQVFILFSIVWICFTFLTLSTKKLFNAIYLCTTTAILRTLWLDLARYLF